jgi:cyclohexa-1,5-dienecarbonyl-CoA hydratase
MNEMAPLRLVSDDGIAQLTLESPPANILTRSVMRELRAALEGLTADRTLRVLVLGAAGRHFSAGADVGEHLPPEYRVMIPEFLATVACLHAFPVPVIAAVRGRCLGGAFELVQAADMVVAGENAQFGQPEILLGVFPPAACAMLPALAGAQRAAELLFAGDAIGAAVARDWGLVSRVVADDAVDAEALALAQRIARHSAAALRSTKRALRACTQAAVTRALDAAGHIYTDDLMQTADAVEGLTAFVEKRQPEWAHR